MKLAHGKRAKTEKFFVENKRKMAMGMGGFYLGLGLVLVLGFFQGHLMAKWVGGGK